MMLSTGTKRRRLRIVKRHDAKRAARKLRDERMRRINAQMEWLNAMNVYRDLQRPFDLAFRKAMGR